MEKTYIMIKPDGFNNAAEIKARIKSAGLNILAEKQIALTTDLLRDHYDFLVDKPFFQDIVNYMTSDIVVGMIVEGKDAVTKMRAIMGVTDPKKADAGTIRHDFGSDISRNVIHGSDSPENAQKEINRFFPELAKEKVVKFAFEALPHKFSLCQVKDYSGVDFDKDFVFANKCDTECALICKTEDAPKTKLTEIDNLVCIRLAPQFDLKPFIGILSSITGLFAENGVPVTVITTHNTCYIFFKKARLEKMVTVLKNAGHIVI